MIRILLIGILLVGLSGCSAHHYRVRGDTLALYLDEPDAREVIFACSLDGFKPHQARREDDRWVIIVPCKEPFRYYYRVDGSLFLPPCKMKEYDDFGFQNCIFCPPL